MSVLTALKEDINNDINQKKGVLKSKEDTIATTEKRIRDLDEKSKRNMEKKLIIQEACKLARDMSAEWFAKLSTNGVQTILGDNLEVKIVTGDKKGVPTCDFYVHAKYGSYETATDPTEEDGGGVADIVSLTNFIAMNALNIDSNSASIILDEPTKFVSAGHADDVGEFISKIAQELDKQIIMVTHAAETKNHADKIFKVELNDKGVSVVSEENNDILPG